MDQQAEGLTWVREGLIRENERLVDDLRVAEEEVGAGEVSVEAGTEVDKEVGLGQRLKDGLEREIQALRAELVELDDSVSTNPDLPGMSSSGPSTSAPNQSLYTVIAHLSQKLGDETRQLQLLEDELRELVNQEITARETAEIARRGKQDQLMGARGSSKKLPAHRGEEPGSDGTEGEEDDEDVEGDSEEERLALEEKDVLEGPAEMSEVEKSLMDLRGYAEVALKTWAEVRASLLSLLSFSRAVLLTKVWFIFALTEFIRKLNFRIRSTTSTLYIPYSLSLMYLVDQAGRNAVGQAG